MGVWDDTLPSPAAGDVVTDTMLMGKILPLLTALTAPWSTYTPIWTAASGTPDLGNGSLTAVYRQIGKTVDYGGCLVLGTTTSISGTGVWRMSLPVTASAGLAVHVGAAWLFNPVHAGTVVINNTTRVEFTAGDASVTGTTPYTMNTNDQLRWSITYEAA